MAPRASDPDAIQAGVAAARTRLLGGRGTGASQAEIDRRTRGRSQLAGEPMPQHLATLAGQTALARGDVAALAWTSPPPETSWPTACRRCGTGSVR
jgi:hypothetical protein